MRLWRAIVWLVPVSALIPLTDAAHRLATFDPSAYFAGVTLVATILLIVIPNGIIFVVGVVGAWLARTHPRTPMVIAAASAVYELTLLPWQPEFWDWHFRAEVIVYTALPGVLAAAIAISGIVLFARSSHVAPVVAAALLLVPAFSGTGAMVQRVEAKASYCPPGPDIDLTFTGAENAHFATACGIPSGVTTLAGCTDTHVGVEMWDWISWDLFFPAANIKRADNGPYLIVGGNTSYGMADWSGDYSFDPGNECAGTVDADLYSGSGSDRAHVHVQGRFQAPG
jgi:hypothetical protein